jgi:PAS domain S-box-containing protein
VVVALGLTKLLAPWLYPTVTPLFFVAVMVSAWVGGWEAGLLATVLSMLAIGYFWIEPRYSLQIFGIRTIVQLGLFAIAAGVISWLSRSRYRALADARAHDQTLRETMEREAAARTRGSQTEEALWQSEARFRAVAANLPQGAVFVVDRDLRYLLAEGKALEDAGMTSEDLVGKTIWEALDLDLAATYEPNYRQALKGEPFSHEHDSHDRHYISHGTPLVNDQGEIYAVLAISYDITDRKRREANLVFLAEIQNDCAHLTTADAMMQTVGAKIGSYLNLSICAFVDVDEAQDRAIVQHNWHRADAPNLMGTYRISEFVSEAFYIAVRAGEIVIVNDTNTDPRTHAENCAALNIQAFIHVPFLRDGQWKFLFNGYDSRPRQWRADEIDLFRELANQIFPRLERARAEEATAADLRDTQLLQELGARFVTEGDIQTLYQEILSAAIALTRANGGTVQMLDSATQKLLTLASQGFSRAVFEHFYRLDASSNTSCDIALRTGDRTFIDFDVPASEDPDGSRRMHLEAGYRSAQSTPLITRSGRAIGMVSTHWSDHYRPSDRELRFLDLLARQAADLIEQRQSEQALRDSEARLQLASAASCLGVWFWDLEMGCLTWSEQCKALFGLPPDTEMSYDTFLAALHPDDRDRAHAAVTHSINHHADYDIEYRTCWQDGSVHWIAAKGSCTYDLTGKPIRMTGVALDISDRKQVEYEREQLLSREQYYTTKLHELNQAAIALNATLSIEAVLNVVTAQAYRIIGTHQAVINIVFEQNWTEAITVAHLSDKYAQWRDYDAQIDGTGIYALICQISQPIRMTQAELEAHPRWRGFGAEARNHPPMRGWLAAPLVGRDGQTVGLIQLSDKYVGEFTEEDEALLVQLAQMASVAVESARSYQGEQHARKSAEAARESADRANRVKDEFLAVLSHELRSPLNPILGWSKLLRQGRLDAAKTEQALKTIERNAQLQSELIEDLLDVSRILQGKLSLNISAVNLATVMRAAMETVRLAAEAKGIEVKCELRGVASEEPDLPAPLPADLSAFMVSGDATRLQQVVWNLLSNAVKFTPAGGHVAVKLASVDNQAQMTIRDNGKGIAPEFLPHVFDYFQQEDSATTRRFGGLGLGLAIVRQIVELHGGTVWAESQGEGLGATFTVRLPLIKRQEDGETGGWGENAHTPHPTPHAPLTGLHILVVDDDSDSRDFIAFVIGQAGATVSIAASGAEAIALLLQSQVDVLLSDVGMPDMDGYMLMQQVRGLPPEQNGQVKAIALTAYAGDFNYQQALQAGFQQHVSKPIAPEALVKAITALLRGNP